MKIKLELFIVLNEIKKKKTR